MTCPCCQTLYQGTRFTRIRGVLWVICPQCGRIPWRAVFPEAGRPRRT
jgi:hypothetical protein